MNYVSDTKTSPSMFDKTVVSTDQEIKVQWIKATHTTLCLQKLLASAPFATLLCMDKTSGILIDRKSYRSSKHTVKQENGLHVCAIYKSFEVIFRYRFKDPHTSSVIIILNYKQFLYSRASNRKKIPFHSFFIL